MKIDFQAFLILVLILICQYVSIYYLMFILSIYFLRIIFIRLVLIWGYEFFCGLLVVIKNYRSINHSLKIKTWSIRQVFDTICMYSRYWARCKDFYVVANFITPIGALNSFESMTTNIQGHYIYLQQLSAFIVTSKSHSSTKKIIICPTYHCLRGYAMLINILITL